MWGPTVIVLEGAELDAPTATLTMPWPVKKVGDRKGCPQTPHRNKAEGYSCDMEGI